MCMVRIYVSDRHQYQTQAILFPHGPDAPPATDNDTPEVESEATISVSRRLLRARVPADIEGDGLVPLLGLRVVVANPSEAYPQLETDESYTLEVGR